MNHFTKNNFFGTICSRLYVTETIEMSPLDFSWCPIRTTQKIDSIVLNDNIKLDPLYFGTFLEDPTCHVWGQVLHFFEEKRQVLYETFMKLSSPPCGKMPIRNISYALVEIP